MTRELDIGNVNGLGFRMVYIWSAFSGSLFPTSIYEIRQTPPKPHHRNNQGAASEGGARRKIFLKKNSTGKNGSMQDDGLDSATTGGKRSKGEQNRSPDSFILNFAYSRALDPVLIRIIHGNVQTNPFRLGIGSQIGEPGQANAA